MNPRSQRVLLAAFIMVLTILLYKASSERGTVWRLTMHAASFADRKASEASQRTAFDPANATLGVGDFWDPIRCLASC